jgi:alkanesulfonate monooxygenase SsuD/methylene tetrahydromethanopterin reductase-like flavin-dependent oxidoreductase (luciferase family)
MKVGLSIPIRMSGEEKENYAHDAKSIGIESIWVGDNPPINNAFLDIGRLLKGVKGIEIWTGITSPFYYSLEVLFALSVWLYTNYPNRFGLGLGIGNPEIFKEDEISTKPFTNFKKSVDQLLEIANIRKTQQKLDDFPPLAIGGLGKRMLSYAKEKADFLLLNSISDTDIKRALSVYGEDKKLASSTIIPYGMMQIQTDNQEVSKTMWNITKDIAKSCSTAVLKEHGYNTQMINKIRELKWDRYSTVPKGEILSIVNDFGILGSIEEVLERLETIKEHQNKSNIDKVVLGWLYSEKQWDSLKDIVKLLK